MLKIITLILVLSASGCMSLKYVDAKGRDCNRNLVLFFFSYDACQKEQEPLATTKQEIKLDADIKQNTTEVK